VYGVVLPKVLPFSFYRRTGEDHSGGGSKDENHMKLIAMAAFLASTLAMCQVASASGPMGYWIRANDRSTGFALSRGPKGAWIVEFHGTPEPGKPANACWNVFVGTMTGTRLVSTSDLGRDFAGQLKADQFLEGEGLFIDFDGSRARISGPEAKANNRWCVLEGDYVHLPGPIIGRP
jgi:hypothetical protein